MPVPDDFGTSPLPLPTTHGMVPSWVVGRGSGLVPPSRKAS